jgi:cytochrome c biogenesis protein CcmG, thiol:disulfide interchange protein DsbE
MNWKRATIAAAAGLPLIALLGFGLTRDPKEIPSPLPGQEAPDFALRVFTPGDTAAAPGALNESAFADTMRLAALRGEVVVLNFWASWCAGCGVEHEALVSVARLYQGKGVRFIGVLYNDTPELGVRWIRRMGGQNYPSLEDQGSRTAIDYGLYGVPETFIIGPDGRVSYKHAGPITAQLLIEKIEASRAGAPAAAAGS